MKVNNLDTPLALAGNSPHFSWQLAGQDDSVLQSAYRLQVFNGDEVLWDSENLGSGKYAFKDNMAQKLYQ